MKAGDARLDVIETHDGFSQKRYWVDVECTDPYWGSDKRRVEVHRDVAYFIFKQGEVIKDLQRQLSEKEVTKVSPNPGSGRTFHCPRCRDSFPSEKERHDHYMSCRLSLRRGQ